MTVKEYNKSVDEFADGIYRFILASAKSEPDARDIVQDAFARLWSKRKEVPFDKAKSYLFATARHRLIDNIRKMKRMEFVDELPDYALRSDDTHAGASDEMNSALQRLPEVQRTLVLLRDCEDYTYSELAAITNCSETQVKVYLFRARKALQQQLKKVDHVV